MKSRSPRHAGQALGVPTPASPPLRQRRALTQVGGVTKVNAVDDSLGRLLRHALSVTSESERANSGVHGFHSYPARVHPDTARRLVEGLTQAGQTVLDPFSGSGTVLVEAATLGRSAVGVDANPLAVELGRLKTLGSTVEQRERLLQAANRVAQQAEGRRRAHSGAIGRHPRNLVEQFEPHVLMELDSLLGGVRAQPDPWVRQALSLVLSALLTKVSRRRSDTSRQRVDRHIAAGFVIRFFRAKTADLVQRLSQQVFAKSRSEVTTEVHLGDARRLPVPFASVDAVITSPPYPGIYDYLDQHRLRLLWLGLDVVHLERHEVGARRSLGNLSPRSARKRWSQQIVECLQEMRRVTRPGGRVALVLGDGVLSGQPWYVEDELVPLADRARLAVVAHASQTRPHFHGPTRQAFTERPRREHLVLLEPQPGSTLPKAAETPRRNPARTRSP